MAASVPENMDTSVLGGDKRSKYSILHRMHEGRDEI
jgi:hypothetical protein